MLRSWDVAACESNGPSRAEVAKLVLRDAMALKDFGNAHAAELFARCRPWFGRALDSYGEIPQRRMCEQRTTRIHCQGTYPPAAPWRREPLGLAREIVAEFPRSSDRSSVEAPRSPSTRGGLMPRPMYRSPRRPRRIVPTSPFLTLLCLSRPQVQALCRNCSQSRLPR